MSIVISNNMEPNGVTYLGTEAWDKEFPSSIARPIGTFRESHGTSASLQALHAGNDLSHFGYEYGSSYSTDSSTSPSVFVSNICHKLEVSFLQWNLPADLTPLLKYH